MEITIVDWVRKLENTTGTAGEYYWRLLGTGEYYCRLGQKAGEYYWGLLESTTVGWGRKLENTTGHCWRVLLETTGDWRILL